jgi:hypothetical protein
MAAHPENIAMQVSAIMADSNLFFMHRFPYCLIVHQYRSIQSTRSYHSWKTQMRYLCLLKTALEAAMPKNPQVNQSRRSIPIDQS